MPPRRPSLAFALAFAGLFGWLLLLESPHLGTNAALHWDAEASITWGPAVGTRAELADARAHLYDVLARVPRPDDPAVVTPFYWSADGLPYHGPLTQCRYYYSYPSDLVGHAAFELGRRLFGTPAAAVLCYQLAAMAMVAAGLAGMLVYAVLTLGSGRGGRAMVGLTFAAVASSPTMLSLARQVLQETPGFALGVATVLAFATAVRRRSVALVAVAGAAAFGAVRCRYTLGPMLGMLLPVAAFVGRDDRPRRGRSPAAPSPARSVGARRSPSPSPCRSRRCWPST